jgi:hypothetical protein
MLFLFKQLFRQLFLTKTLTAEQVELGKKYLKTFLDCIRIHKIKNSDPVKDNLKHSINGFCTGAIQESGYFKKGKSPFDNKGLLEGNTGSSRKILLLLATHVLKFLFNKSGSTYTTKSGETVELINPSRNKFMYKIYKL